MDIRKEWESCLRTPEVQALFQSLKEGDSSFWAFDSLEQFVGFMNKPSPDAYAIKDGCLWRIIQHIQTTSNGVAGLSLLTYLMANALQAILRDVNRPQTNTKANFQDVWWQFLQAVVAYPLTRRPHKVAANLAMDTRRRLWNDWRSEDQRASMLVPLDGAEIPVAPRFDDPLYISAHRMIEIGEVAGVRRSDSELVLASRVYDQDLRDLADEAGISYDSLRKRRQRAEMIIRKEWLKEK